MKKAQKKGDQIILRFGGNNKRETLYFIKSLPHAKWNIKTECWTIPNRPALVGRLKRYGFELDYSLRVTLLEGVLYQDEEAPKQYKDMWGSSEFAWQEKAFKFVSACNDRALIVADPGAGKTPFSVRYVEWKNLFPCLVICPNNVKYNWNEKIREWSLQKRKSVVLEGGSSLKKYDVDYVVMNYDLISSGVDVTKMKRGKRYTAKDSLIAFKETGFKSIIIDETQYIKDEHTSTYRGVKYLCEDIPSIIGLSGTPIENYIKEFFNIANIIRPDIFPNRWEYLNHFCKSRSYMINKRGSRKKIPIQEFKGLHHGEDLNKILCNTLMLRVKRDNNTERIVVPFSIDEELYNDSLQEFLETTTENNAMAKFEWLKQVCYELKKEKCFYYIDSIIKQYKKVLVFAVNKKVVSDVMNYYESVATKIDGDVSAADKLEAVKEFNRDKSVLVANIRAGAAGVDGLQKVCNNVVSLQFPWHERLLEQEEGRLDRGGQTKPVTHHLLVAKNTIDEDIIKLIDGKGQHFDMAVNGGENPDKETLMNLLKEYKKKK